MGGEAGAMASKASTRALVWSWSRGSNVNLGTSAMCWLDGGDFFAALASGGFDGRDWLLGWSGRWLGGSEL